MIKEIKAPAQAFVPQTIINSLPDGIQVIASIAPQTTIIIGLTLDQVKEAVTRCVQLRYDNGLVDPAAFQAAMKNIRNGKS